MGSFPKEFFKQLPKFRKELLAALKSAKNTQGFRSAWESFEDIINPYLITNLSKPPLSIPKECITVAQSKSVYPDIKIQLKNKKYAVDIKSGEDSIDPWYDIGRLDTYEEKRLDEYEAEFSVVVRWKGRDPVKVVAVYIEPTFRTAGFSKRSKGVLFRPNDGKIRPKAWKHFEKHTTHWKNKTAFREGLIRSRHYRQRHYLELWYKHMNKKQRRAVAKTLAKIDAKLDH